MRTKSLSVATTSCPTVAKQLPVTNPTYPQPMTAIRMALSPPLRRLSVAPPFDSSKRWIRLPNPDERSSPQPILHAVAEQGEFADWTDDYGIPRWLGTVAGKDAE